MFELQNTNHPSKLNRRFLLRMAASSGLVSLAGCGGGSDGEERDGAGGAVLVAPSEKFAATTLVELAQQIPLRFPGLLPQTVLEEIQRHTTSDTDINPSQTRSAVQGEWLGALDRGGDTRVFNGSLVNQENSLIPPGTDVRTGYTQFLDIQAGTGAGVATVRNARDGLRLDNGDLQAFVGYRPGITVTPDLPAVDSIMIMTFGDIHDGLGGPLVGTSINLWQASLGALGASLSADVTGGQISVNAFKARYRSWNTRDLLGGPIGLVLDFDVVMERTA